MSRPREQRCRERERDQPGGHRAIRVSGAGGERQAPSRREDGDRRCALQARDGDQEEGSRYLGPGALAEPEGGDAPAGGVEGGAGRFEALTRLGRGTTVVPDAPSNASKAS